MQGCRDAGVQGCRDPGLMGRDAGMQGAGMQGCRAGMQHHGAGNQILTLSPDEEGDQGAPAQLGTEPAVPQAGDKAGPGRGQERGRGLGSGTTTPGSNAAAVPQERQNIIRYWLENLRAKQGESLHNIHFLEGQPISECGTARSGTATPPPRSLCPARAQAVPGWLWRTRVQRGSPCVPIPGGGCRSGGVGAWWLRQGWARSPGVPRSPPNPSSSLSLPQTPPCRATRAGSRGGWRCPLSPSLTPCPAAQSRSWRPAASSSRSSRCTSRGSSNGS